MAPQLTNDQLKALGMDTMPTVTREQIYERLGKLVFDSALLRLIETFSDDQLYALNHTIESYDAFDGVVGFLEQTYPQFTQMLQEEQERCAGLFVTKVVTNGL